MHHFQMIKQKVYWLPENFDQLSNLNIGFVSVLLFLIDICCFCIVVISVDCSFKNDCCNSFALSWVDKVTTWTQSFVSVIANVVAWFAGSTRWYNTIVGRWFLTLLFYEDPLYCLPPFYKFCSLLPQPPPPLLFSLPCFLDWMCDPATFDGCIILMIWWICTCQTLVLEYQKDLEMRILCNKAPSLLSYFFTIFIFSNLIFSVSK